MLFWSAARGRARDVSTILAHSFFLLLIGLLLRDSWSALLLAIYAANAALVLFLEREARLVQGARIRVSGRESSRHFATRILAITLALASLGPACTALLLEVIGARDEQQLPQRSRRVGSAMAKDGADRRGKRTGLSERFFLERLGSGRVRTARQTLCFVEALDGEALPRQLYLRVSAFELPAKPEWKHVARPDRRSAARFHRLGPAAGATRRIRLRGLEGLGGLVPLAPGLVELSSQRELELERGSVIARAAKDGKTIVCDQRFASYVPQPTRMPRDVDPSLLAVPQRLRVPELEALAAGLPAASDGLPDLLEAVEELLATRCSYVLNDPEGRYEEAILDFLFEAKRGYCMHFAGAACILLRMRGVACRVANGLFEGCSGLEAEALEIDATSEWRRAWPEDPALRRAFGSQHAHAWVEIPSGDDARHWHVFDPTPAPSRGLERARDREVEEALAQNKDAAGAAALSPWTIALVLLGALVLLRFGLWRRVETSARAHAHSLKTTRAQGHFERMLAVLARLGVPREDSESWLAYAARLRRSPRIHAADASTLEDAVLSYCELRYGGRELSAEHEARLEGGLRCARADRARSGLSAARPSIRPAGASDPCRCSRGAG